jgi:alpha-tubulin suppressor-like RCC1 family protein
MVAWCVVAYAALADTAISAGDNHTLALREDGTVLAWGSDRYGQLGLGRTVIALAPTRVNGVATRNAPNSLAGGDSHFVLLQADGSVWAWGSNRNGQLGDGSTADSPIPIRVTGLPSNVVAVAAGGDHSMALTSDGNVWVWGNNQFGELGDGTTTRRPSPFQVPGLANVASIAIGYFHAAVVKRDGTVWTWGNNQFGQLGDGTTTERHSPGQVSALGTTSSKVALGDWHTLVIRNDTTLWAFGFNNEGQLGDGTQTNRSTPVQVPGLRVVSVAGGGLTGTAPGVHNSAAIATDGALWVWGAFGGGGPLQPALLPQQVPGFSGGIELSSGAMHLLIRRNDGTLWGYGSNNAAQLFPTITAAGVQNGPLRIAPNLSGIATIAAAGQASAAVLADGSTYAWGSNSDGQVGIPTVLSRPVPTLVPDLNNVVQVAAGGTGRFYQTHSVALKRDGTVWAWGSNFYGQLGRGATAPLFSSVPAQVSGLDSVQNVSAGGNFTLAVKRDGTVWLWGNGGLGVGAAAINVTNGVPTQVAGLSGIFNVRAGKTFAFAFSSDGTVYAWGDNRFGQLGFTSSETCPDPSGASVACTTRPTVVPALFGFRDIAAGARHSVGVKADGTLWAWGDNTFGELGDGTFTSRSTPMQVTALSNVIGAAAAGNDLDPAGYTVAGLRDGSIWTWGSNKFGQLGDGTRTDRATPTQVLNIGTLAGGSAGNRHVDVILADGSVIAWGANYFGQLGDGTFTIRTRPVMVLHESGTGDIATNNWYLDLAPSVSKIIPPDRIPPFLATASGDANTALVNIDALVKFRTQDVGKRIHVFAIAPTSLLKRAGENKDGGSCTLAQVTPNGTLQAASASTLTSTTTGVTTSQGQAVTILTNTPSSNVAGATFCVGTGATGSDSTSQGNNQCVATVPGGTTCFPSSLAANTPDGLSGLWWKSDESGWGIHFTQRGNIVFAAWYTYDGSGNPKWYVSTCTMPSGTTGTSGTCNGTVYEVSGPTFFGTPFNSAAVTPLANGTLQVTFQNAGNALMTYTGVAGQSRTNVALTRQPLAAGATQPAINYTDIWWAGANESGWGMAITQQFSTVFLAWYVYDGAGKPTWYVATCTLSGTACAGSLLRTTGPNFGPGFDPNQVHVFTAGTVSVNFTDGNNAMLNYTVGGVIASKNITRQLF